MRPGRDGVGGRIPGPHALTRQRLKAAWGQNCYLHFSPQDSLEDSCSLGLITICDPFLRKGKQQNRI